MEEIIKRISTIKRHELLPTPYYVKALEEINGQSDRGAAIAGTAYLDLLLRRALETLMRPLPELQNRLFENRGGLSDFSTRIDAAFAFKLIGPTAHVDLRALRDVRNAFAHSADTFGFDREDIAARCSSLWFASKIRFGGRPMPVSARASFIREVELLAQGLNEVTREDAGRIPPHLIHLGPGPAKASRPQSKTRPSKSVGSQDSN